MVHSWGQLQHQSGGVFGVNDLVGGLVQDAGADGFDAGHGFFQIVGGQSDGRQAFASIGEKLDEFEIFHPERLASRILGMGDVESLIEKAEEVFDKEEAEETAARLMEGTFTLEDFLGQMQQIKKMGPLQEVFEKMPFFGDMLPAGVQLDDGELVVRRNLPSSVASAASATSSNTDAT